MTILEIPLESWITRVKKTHFRFFINLFVFLIFITFFSILFLKIKTTYILLLILFIVFIILLRLLGFNSYIYKIEKEDNKLIITYLKFGKVLTTDFEISNCKIHYFRNPKGVPVFRFEQLKPYKLILFQGCYGYWTKIENIEIFRPYVREIKYFN